MKHKHGFTLVELIVVITILGILMIIAVFNHLNVQRHARDEQRAADAIIVSESLEKYFAENGEYPSVAQITDTNGNTVKQLLGLPGIDSLVAPLATGTTNSWKSGGSNTADTVTFTYSGNQDASTACNSPTQLSADDRCTDFKVQYYNEQEGEIVTLYSRNKSVAIDTLQREGMIIPDVPTITAALAGTNVTATSSQVECQVGATAQYAFQNRTNNGTWSNWTAWGTGKTSSLTAAQGTKYGFRTKARCAINTSYSGESGISAEASYTHPINTPAAPVLTVQPAADKNSGTWSWPAAACPSGTTAQYVTTYYRDDATGWRAYNFSAPQTATSVLYTTNYEGYEYRAKAQARCISAFATSGWSADSNTPSYVNPVTPPADAFNFRWGTDPNGAPIYTWSEPACGLGTVLERRQWSYLAATQYRSDGTSSPTGSAFIAFNSTRPPSADIFEQWRYLPQTKPSELDMTYISRYSYVLASSIGAGYYISTGSPNTESIDTNSTRAAVQLKCRNLTTNREAEGNFILGALLYR